MVRGVVVDTAYFTGNYPPFVSVEGPVVDGYPAASELDDLDWTTLVPRSPARGDTANAYPVTDDRVWTHVRLTIHPDGGVARFRVHGEPVPDPRFTGGVDLAARGARGRAGGLLRRVLRLGREADPARPGPAHGRGLGERPAPRRGQRLGAVPARPPRAWRTTSSWTRRTSSATHPVSSGSPAATAGSDDPAGLDAAAWWDLVPRRPARPDTRHRFLVDDRRPLTHVRLDVYPDGGMARLRVWGQPTG